MNGSADSKARLLTYGVSESPVRPPSPSSWRSVLMHRCVVNPLRPVLPSDPYKHLLKRPRHSACRPQDTPGDKVDVGRGWSSRAHVSIFSLTSDSVHEFCSLWLCHSSLPVALQHAAKAREYRLNISSSSPCTIDLTSELWILLFLSQENKKGPLNKSRWVAFWVIIKHKACKKKKKKSWSILAAESIAGRHLSISYLLHHLEDISVSCWFTLVQRSPLRMDEKMLSSHFPNLVFLTFAI